MNEKNRINAMIAYFFLGPLFLLARTGTPMRTEFVYRHAKRASIILGVSLVLFVVYFYFFRNILDIRVLGINIHTIVIGSSMFALSLILLHGSYRAYQGIDAADISWKANIISNELVEGQYSEEDKVRIIASFLPFLGIWITARYPRRETEIGRALGSVFAMILITLWVFVGSASTLIFFTTLVGIVLFVMNAVYIFVYERFLVSSWYQYIPTYPEIEAHIYTSGHTLYDMLRVIGGGKKTTQYNTLYDEKRVYYTRILPATTPYVLPGWILAIPIINLASIPTSMRVEYSEYRGLIMQGITLSVLSILMVMIYGIGASILLYLLFPIVGLLTHHRNILYRAPIVSPVLGLISLSLSIQERYQHIGSNQKETSFTYEETKK